MVLQVAAWQYRAPASADPWSTQPVPESKAFDFNPLLWTAEFWEENEIPAHYRQALMMAYAASQRGGSVESNFKEQFARIPSEERGAKRRRVD
jgi:hypothetical protein